MIHKALRLVVPAGLALLVASQWPDIRRYLKIKQISVGEGHPENVPAGGRTSYPQIAEDGLSEGTADFDSASRGGPKQ